MSNPKIENIVAVLETKNTMNVSIQKHSLAYLKLFEKWRKLPKEVNQQLLVEFIETEIAKRDLHYWRLYPKNTSDKRIIELTKFKMSDETQKILEELLEKQQEGGLSELEQVSLDFLMEFYEQGLLLKSEALRVAVERGLIEPLSK